MLPDDWEAWARPYRKRPLWTSLPSTVHAPVDQEGIRQFLPHRDPFLLLDQIVSWDAAQRTAQARRLIRTDDPIFTGHFPGDPVYPGVLQVEMAGQLAVWLLGRLQQHSGALPGVRVLKLHHAVFVSPVLPGDLVDVLASVIDADGVTTVVAGQVGGMRGVTAVAAMELIHAES